MANPRVSRNYANVPGGVLETFATGTNLKMPANPAYPDAPVTPAAMKASIETFHEAMAKMVQGGTEATAFKNECRASLIALLDQQANYVQTACGNDLSVLLSSGFEAVSTNRGQSVLETPVILLISNPASDQLALRIQAVANAKSYEVRYRLENGEYVHGGVFASTRGVVLEGLIAGKAYTVQVRAIGGSTGSSGWSDPQSRFVI